MQKQKQKTPRVASAAFASLALKIAVLGAASVTLTNCAQGFDSSKSPVAQNIDQSLGCKNFEDKLWTAFNKSIEDTGRPPSADEIQAALGTSLKSSLRLGKLSSTTQSKIVTLTGDIATTISLRNEKGLATEALNDLDLEDRRNLWLERVAQLEIGDRTTDEKSKDVDDVQAKFAALKALAVSEGLETSCAVVPATPAPTEADTSAGDAVLFNAWKTSVALPVYGGMKSVSTMYQSCEAGTRAPLGNDVANVQGITVVGKHPSGTGNVRQVTNKAAFLASHPYVGKSVYKRPLPSCADVQAVPSIYDYGGKPYTSTTDEKVMNFFKNAGTGSKELGIDCSGLVYSAYATAGLKFKKTTALKATLVNGISSTMLTQPQKNGLTCLDFPAFTANSNLAAGDIIAIAGHVVMVADVGADPLGIASIDSAPKCTAANMSISRFNFSIFQSSPSKGGIGVNRMRAKEYLTAGSTMGAGMIDHAVNACKAKFQSAALVSKSSRASVVRHLGTSDCKDAVPVKLTQEECLSSCSARALDSI